MAQKGCTCEDLCHLNPLEHMPEDHFLAVIYGVRRSGKTTMLRQFIYDMYPKVQDWKVFVFCSTAQFNTTSYDWVPKKAIFSDPSEIEKKMEELLSQQREKLEKLAKAGKLDKETKAKSGGTRKDGGKSKKRKADSGSSNNGKRSNPKHAHEREHKQKLTEAARYALQTGEEEEGESDVPDILVIMDDVCAEDAIRHARAMGTVAMNGRQYRISCVVLSQMVAGSGSIPPRVRTQVLSGRPVRVVCHRGSDESTVSCASRTSSLETARSPPCCAPSASLLFCPPSTPYSRWPFPS